MNFRTSFIVELSFFHTLNGTKPAMPHFSGEKHVRLSPAMIQIFNLQGHSTDNSTDNSTDSFYRVSHEKLPLSALLHHACLIPKAHSNYEKCKRMKGFSFTCERENYSPIIFV